MSGMMQVPEAKIFVDHTAAEQHLRTILNSPAFRPSRRCQDFLRFVVVETLAGRSDSIRERNIGVAVFERGAGYDPTVDSIVRVKANELRKRLAKFYETNEGADSNVRIELTAGSYVPVIRSIAEQNVQSEAQAAPAAAVVPPTLDKIPVSGRRWWPEALACCGLVALTLAWISLRPAESSLDRLWYPFIGHRNLVLLFVPSPTVQETRPGSLRTMEQ